MYQYDAQDYPYASKRHVVYAKMGCAALVTLPRVRLGCKRF